MTTPALRLEPGGRGARLEVEGLRKSFGRLEVLKGVDLRPAPGRVTALVGPNGAGKSTLVKSVLGLVRPGGGVIRLDGGFAGLFQLDFPSSLFSRNYQDPVLVACTDGVGTKLEVAVRSGRHDTVGIDLVAEDVDTIAGLIVSVLGRIPGVGEAIEHNGLRFEIVKADRRRIDQVKVSRLQEIRSS